MGHGTKVVTMVGLLFLIGISLMVDKKGDLVNNTHNKAGICLYPDMCQ